MSVVAPRPASEAATWDTARLGMGGKSAQRDPTERRVRLRPTAVGEGLAWLDNLAHFARAIPELEAPPRDVDENLAITVFCGEHARSFDSAVVGGRIATRRIELVAIQTEQMRDHVYMEKAQRRFTEIQEQFASEIAVADRMQGSDFKTKLLTKWDSSVLTSPILIRGCYPPENTDSYLGWADTSIPTTRVLERFGLLDAWRAGKVALIDLHDCDKHSATAGDPTFPVPLNGAIDWDSHGCSDAHHKAFMRRDAAIEEFRLEKVFGETLNFGYGIVKPWHDDFLATSSIPNKSLKRRFHPRHDDEGVRVPEPYSGAVHLHWAPKPSAPASPTTSPSAATTTITSSEEQLSTRIALSTAATSTSISTQTDQSMSSLADRVSSFTYLSHTTSHLSYAYYAQPDTGAPLLARIAATDRAFQEAAFLIGAACGEEDTWLLSRSYMARCLGKSRGFFIPVEVRWAYERLADKDDACAMWTAAQVEERVAGVAASRLAAYTDQWERSGRTIIGKSFAPDSFLAKAIAGWKICLRAHLERAVFPMFGESLHASIGAIVPTSTADGRPCTGSFVDRAVAYTERAVYPLLDHLHRTRHMGAVTPASTADGRPATVTGIIHARSGNRWAIHPVYNQTAAGPIGAVAPATTADGRPCAKTAHESWQPSVGRTVFPSFDPSFALGAIVVSSTADGRVRTEGLGGYALLKKHHLWYPTGDTSRTALHISSATTADGRATVISWHSAKNSTMRLDQVLTMESLRDLTSDLSNVRRDELKRFATEQGWAIPKKSTLREGMIDYLRKCAVRSNNIVQKAKPMNGICTLARLLDPHDTLEDCTTTTLSDFGRSQRWKMRHHKDWTVTGRYRDDLILRLRDRAKNSPAPDKLDKNAEVTLERILTPEPPDAFPDIGWMKMFRYLADLKLSARPASHAKRDELVQLLNERVRGLVSRRLKDVLTRVPALYSDGAWTTDLVARVHAKDPSGTQAEQIATILRATPLDQPSTRLVADELVKLLQRRCLVSTMAEIVAALTPGDRDRLYAAAVDRGSASPPLQAATDAGITFALDVLGAVADAIQSGGL